MPSGGDILIRTEARVVEDTSSDGPAPGSYVVVRIQDCGRGMPSDILRQVLDPFFTTKGKKGTGLGLP
jgi:signal transduction histidine kinase